VRIYTKGGDLAFEEFTFPDGQPHFKLLTWERDFPAVTIELAIKSPTDLFRARMAQQVLRASGFYNINLDIRYLLGARMDRPIDNHQPFTLALIAQYLVGGFSKIRVLDCHSAVGVNLLGASNVLPYEQVKQVIHTLGDVLAVIPDAGARGRVDNLTRGLVDDVVQAEKHRDMATGRIEGMKIEGTQRVKGRKCLIIDDICDGGATFTALAKGLKAEGATEVHLFVTHLIMSKGHRVFDGLIDRVFCTDSFKDWSIVPFTNISSIPVQMEKM
jgi:ribose-phosphate pyrophosphokinase